MSVAHVTTKRCLYCGNNQISHLHATISSRFDHVVFPVLERCFAFPLGKMLLRGAEYLLDALFNLLVVVHVVQFTTVLEKIGNDRGKVLAEEAVRRGYRVEVATVFGKVMDVYRYTLPNGTVITFNGLPRVEKRGVAGVSHLDDKAHSKEILSHEHIPVSRGTSFHDVDKACAYFKTCTYPVIVKPRFGSRGRHTTTYITNEDDFRDAFLIAQEISYHVMVEEHLIGSVYRGTMIDGRLAGVLAGDPPRVTGDGIHTVAELIVIKNESRHERVGAYSITEMTGKFLKRCGYTLETILEAGKTIDLSEKIGLSYGGNAREVTPKTHPKYKEILEKAARVVDDPIIGFDFITPDIEADPDTVRWGIIECNAVPFINLHHDPLEGEPVNVAGIFLDYVEQNIMK